MRVPRAAPRREWPSKRPSQAAARRTVGSGEARDRRAAMPYARGMPTPPSAVSDIEIVIRAAAFAAHKHRDQRRKDAGATPYINHPLGLARILTAEGGV